jgi:hypothetical protein
MSSLASRLASLALVALLSFLPSCQTPSPATRIAAKPAIFAALPAKQQVLVQQGQIAEGMSKDAVYLAWGSPSQQFAAGQGGRNYELWRYTGLQPIYVNRVYSMGSFGWGGGFGGGPWGPGCGAYGPGWGRRGGFWGGPSFAYNMGPDYVPFTAAEVKFSSDKVSSWQRVK